MYVLDIHAGGIFPKERMKGKKSCEGIIDDVCISIKTGNKLPTVPPIIWLTLKTRRARGNNLDIPPGIIPNR